MTPDLFTPQTPLPCPDCQELGTEFLNHKLIGWLCPDCYKRAQGACDGLAKYRRVA